MAAVVSSCAIIDLRQLSIATNPVEAAQVLAEGEQISLTFSRPVLETETETLISITSAEEAVDIDFLWEKNTVVLQPVKSLQPATRYFLEIEGRVPLANGAYRDSDILIPFYFLSDEEKMRLFSVSPIEFGITGASDPLIFTFSREPDLSSFTLNFTLTPDTPCTTEKKGNSITVSPDPLWESCTLYEWNIAAAFSSVEKIPLLEPGRGLFLVQEDTSAPEVLDCFPTEYTGAEPVPLSQNMNDIGYTSDIALLFSEPVEASSVTAAFSLDPAVEGHLVCHSDSLYIFSPLDGWDFQTEYSLSVSTGLTAENGNPAIRPFTLSFIPETIAEISITAVEGVGDAQEFFLLDTLSPQNIDVDELDNGSYTFTIFFSQPYPAGYQTELEDRVAFEFMYPGGLSPERRSLLWGPGNTSLSIIYEHITWAPPLPGFTNMYRFTITGGKGTGNGTGGYIKEDLTLIMECDT